MLSCTAIKTSLEWITNVSLTTSHFSLCTSNNWRFILELIHFIFLWIYYPQDISNMQYAVWFLNVIFFSLICRQEKSSNYKRVLHLAVTRGHEVFRDNLRVAYRGTSPYHLDIKCWKSENTASPKRREKNKILLRQRDSRYKYEIYMWKVIQ